MAMNLDTILESTQSSKHKSRPETDGRSPYWNNTSWAITWEMRSEVWELIFDVASLNAAN